MKYQHYYSNSCWGAGLGLRRSLELLLLQVLGVWARARLAKVWVKEVLSTKGRSQETTSRRLGRLHAVLKRNDAHVWAPKTTTSTAKLSILGELHRHWKRSWRRTCCGLDTFGRMGSCWGSQRLPGRKKLLNLGRWLWAIVTSL